MYLAFSWRNIWRNKKRTIIAAASVFFAVLLACVMRSSQNGSYSYMIDSSAKLFTGYLQIQGKGYWENRSIDKSIVLNKQTTDKIAAVPHLTHFTGRLESFSLISNGNSTKVAEVVGIQPERESRMTGLKKKLIAGSYFTGADRGVLIAAGLAEMLHVSVGDSIILYGQGYHGQIAAANLPVTGVVKLPFQEMNNGMVFLTLANAQDIFAAYGRITSFPILIDNVKNLSQVLAGVRDVVDKKYEIMTWDEMMPDLVQSIQLDNASGLIMLAILYIVIGFGVFGTVMMMISEREKEFGILIAVGMKRYRLIFVTTIETILVSFLGVVTGILASIPLIRYLHNHPIPITGEAAKTFDSLGIEAIFNFSTDFSLLLHQALIVLIIALITAIYPVLFIRKLKPVTAFRR